MKHKTIRVGLLLVNLCGLASAANIAYVAKAAPGDNTMVGAGKQWPTSRFVDDVSGNCKIDNLTGLMWAKNAGLLGTGTWGTASVAGTAQYKVTQMNIGDSAEGYHLCGYSDWRLPNQKELLSLLNYIAANGNQADWLNDSAQGFNNVQPSDYWSSTPGGNGAWNVYMLNGSSGSSDLNNAYYVWPVRGGQ